MKKIVWYMLNPFIKYTVYRVYRIELDKLVPREVARNDLVFKFIDWEDAAAIQEIEGMEEWLSGKVGSKLQNGLCLVALDKGKIVGFNLIAFGEVFLPLIETKRPLADNEAWSEQITVRKSYRKKGIAVDLRYIVFSELKRREIKVFYGAALKENKPSLKLARKVGFEEITDIYFYKIFGCKKWYHKDLRK
jgi:GNAT superfamily N-acetyltransferase